MKRSVIPPERERLAEFARQKRVKYRTKPYTPAIEISSEMRERLRFQFEDALEDCASPLVPPLSASAVLAPIDFLSKNVNLAIETPQQTLRLDTAKQPGSSPGSTLSTLSLQTSNPSLLGRMNALLSVHHRRQAEREDIPPQEAVEHLAQAIQYHLDPHEPVSIHPEEVFRREFKYVVYEPWVVVSVQRIQRWYKRLFAMKKRAAGKISNWFFDYLQYRNFQRDLRIAQQCAQLIQRKYRQRLKRLHLHARCIQRWYRRVRSVAAKVQRFTPYTAVRAIQSLLRSILLKRRLVREKLETEAAVKLQKHLRRYFANSRRLRGILIIRRHIEDHLIKIQSYLRRYQARLLCERIRQRRRGEESLRLRAEAEYLDHCRVLEYIKWRLYCSTGEGKLHAAYSSLNLNQFDRKLDESREEVFKSKLDRMLDEYFHVDSQHIPRIAVEMSIPIARLPQLFDYCVDALGEVQPDLLKSWCLEYRARLNHRIKGKTLNSEYSAYDDILRLYYKWIKQTKDDGISKFCRHNMLLHEFEHQCRYRELHPPLYVCCQCDATFSLFLDYNAHFDHDNRCLVTNEAAVFWINPKFSNWKEHLMRCRDIVRARREALFVRNKVQIRLFKELHKWRNRTHLALFFPIQNRASSMLRHHGVNEDISLFTAFSIIRHDYHSTAEELSQSMAVIETCSSLLPKLKTAALSLRLAVALLLHYVECTIQISATEEFRVVHPRFFAHNTIKFRPSLLQIGVTTIF